MKLGYELVIEQTQKLVMTPELIQAIKILQFTSQELEQYIDEQLQTNPVLEIDERASDERERDKESYEDLAERSEVFSDEAEEPQEEKKERDDIDWNEYLADRGYDDISYRHMHSRYSGEEMSFEPVVQGDISLTEYLMTQVQFICLDTECRRIARWIIESLDENGYLSVELHDIPMIADVERPRVEEALSAVQRLDPPGVGARNLKESLRLQLERKGEDDDIALALIEHHLEDIADNRMAHIARIFSLSAEEAQAYCDRIRCLEPKPGSPFGASQPIRYVMADVTVEQVDDEYLVLLNESGAPRLRISPYYRKVLAEAGQDSQITEFLHKRLNAATWLIRSIHQRQQTIQSVVEAIVAHQKAFFERGIKHLRPMTLAEIADEAGVHESTVSRAVSGKYVQTPRGLFELKFFFTGGVSAADGKGVASGSVKELLKEMVEAEDPASPLSDQVISDRLKKERGISVSRRTVAKYRGELQIPASSRRRRY